MTPSEQAAKRLRAALPNNTGSPVEVFVTDAEIADALNIPRQSVRALLRKTGSLVFHCMTDGTPLFPASQLQRYEQEFEALRAKGQI